MTPMSFLGRALLAAAVAGVPLAGGAAPVPALGDASSVGLVVVLLVAGFAFLGAELFVIPGFGVAGVVGGAALVAGVVLAWSRFGVLWGMGLTLGSLALLSLGLHLGLRTRAGQRLVLDTSLADARAVPDEVRAMIGQRGVAVTPLRPAGSALVGDERLDVETDGEYIEAGAPVLVVDARLGRLVVEAAPADAAESRAAKSQAADATGARTALGDETTGKTSGSDSGSNGGFDPEPDPKSDTGEG